MRSDIGPFAIVPLWLIKRGVSSTAIHLYATLAAVYADKEGKSWPSRAALAESMSCSTDTIDRAVKELVHVQALVKERRWRSEGAFGQKSNGYTLRYAKPGEESPQICGDHEPHQRVSSEPQNTGSNHTHIEPDPDPALRAGAPVGAPPARGDRRLNPGSLFGPFAVRWRKKYPGVDITFGAKEGKLAKQLLLRYPPEELERRMDRYFARDDAFYADAAYPFELFVAHINRFVPRPGERLTQTADEDDEFNDPETTRVLEEERAERARRKAAGRG